MAKKSLGWAVALTIAVLFLASSEADAQARR